MKSIITLSGKSASGKSTLAQKLVETDLFEETVSFTTRVMRPGEIDGVHYNFISKEEFEKNKMNGIVLEYTNINGNLYGTDINALNNIYEKGKIPVIVCDPECPITLYKKEKELDLNIIPVFITASPDILAQRLVERLKEEFTSIQELKEQSIDEYLAQEDKLKSNYLKRIQGMSDLPVDEIENLVDNIGTQSNNIDSIKVLSEGISSPYSKESKWESMVKYKVKINADAINGSIEKGIKDIIKEVPSICMKKEKRKKATLSMSTTPP